MSYHTVPARVIFNDGSILDGRVVTVPSKEGDIPAPCFITRDSTFRHDHSTADGLAVYIEDEVKA